MAHIYSSKAVFVTERRTIPAKGDYPERENVTLSDGKSTISFTVPQGAIPATEGPQLLAIAGELVVKSGSSASGRWTILELVNVKVTAASN